MQAAPEALRPDGEAARDGGSPGAPPQPGFALEAIDGLGAAAFAGLLLWTLPAFLGLASTPAVVADLLAATAAAYLIAGPHAGGRRLRAALPVLTAAALLLTLLIWVLVPGGPAGLATFVGEGTAQLVAWASGVSPTLAGPAALPVAAALGLAVGLPVFHTARAGRPALALLLGFALLVVEWEFVDDATIRLFWPLVGVALFWLAADRARETARTSEVDIGSPTPWTAFGMAGLAGAAVLAALLIVPRQGGPADLGRLGVWIDHLPVIGSIEAATREGNLGYGSAGSGSGLAPGAGPAIAGTPALRTGGFSLQQTGFSPDVARLGGPASPDSAVALQLTVSADGALPPVLYLRGAVRDVYNGDGWLPDAEAETDDPDWPSVSAGDVGRAFLSGAPLPAPYSLVSARLEMEGAASANLFTLLLPLRLPVEGVEWDQVGEVWASAALPAGFGYGLTAAVLSPAAYSGTDLASYAAAGAPGRSLSPDAALQLAESGVAVEPAASGAALRNVGSLPLASDLQLPGSLSPAVADLARSWTDGLGQDPLLEALAIQQQLAAHYTYTLDAPAVPAGDDFVDYFLFTARRGYCTSYSSAMVVLLRTLGIPARWVEGYRVAVPPQGGSFVVREDAAHAWVEAYVAPYGWLTFDPTPNAPFQAVQADGAAAGRAGSGGLGLLAGAGALRWWVLGGIPGALALLLLGNGLGNLALERRRASTPLQRAAVVWRACERVGTRFGRPRHGCETPAEYLAELGARYPGGAGAAADLAAEYGRLRFGPGEAPEAAWERARRLEAVWAALQAELRAAAPLTYPLRRWL